MAQKLPLPAPAALQLAAVGMRIAHDCLVDIGLNAIYNKSYNVNSFLYCHYTAHLAPLYIVLAPVGALNGTMGHAVAQQVSASSSKGMHLKGCPSII